MFYVGKVEVLQLTLLIAAVGLLIYLFSVRRRKRREALRRASERAALRKARSDMLAAVETYAPPVTMEIATTYENESARLAIARLFKKHGWRVRIEFLEEFKTGRFRIVLTSPRTPAAVSESRRAVKGEEL